MRILRGFVLVVSCVIVTQVGLIAQAPPTPTVSDDLGLTGYESYHGGDIDSVNLSNGAPVIHIPVLSYPQRGGQLGVSFSSTHNGKEMQVVKICDPFSGCDTEWTYSLDLDPTANSGIGPSWTHDQDISVVHIAVQDPHTKLIADYASLRYANGTTHYMGQTGGVFAQQPLNYTGFKNKQYESRDGSEFKLAVDGSGNEIITTPSGAIYNPSPGSNILQEDPNGNVITSNTGGLVDTLGRQIPVAAVASDTSGCPQGGNLLPVTSATIWSGSGYGGTPFQVKFCNANVTVSIPSTLNLGGTWNKTAVQSIVFPGNNTAWTFEYNDRNPGDPTTVNYGSITKIRLPTGGSITYTYVTGTLGALGNIDLGSRWVASRTVDANDGTGGHTWTYSYRTGPIKTIVTDPLNNDTVHTFGSYSQHSLMESKTQYYQGPQANNILLKTVDTQYSLLSGVLPVSSQTTWPSGKVKKTITAYDAGFTNFDNNGNHTTEYGDVTSISEYDYGSSAPFRQTNTTYSWQSGTNAANYLNANMLHMPTSVIVTDGTNKCSETDYAYDDPARLSTPSPAVTTQHLAAPYAVRGNPSSSSFWLSSTPCQANATGRTVAGYTNYFDTGTVNQQIDPLGNKTTYSYSSAYVGALVTQIQNPLLQNTQYAYDLNTGQVMSTTDPNSQPTTYGYDALWRVNQIKSPNQGAQGQGETDVTYNETSFPFSVTITTKITSSPVLNLTHTTVIDGLGRVTQKRLASDPENPDFVDIVYDALGRKASESNPYRTQQDTTYGITSYSYDALGRVITMIPPDGSATTNNVATSYANFPLVTDTDEAGKSRTSQTDGVGRLVSVWEDPSNLNLQSNYQYDPLGNLLCVEQHGGVTGTGCSSPPGSDATSPWRVRRFSYDSHSRLLSAKNPESATISYSYDDDGNLHTKTALSPNQPQTGTATITTTYTYDALNRLTGKSYADTYPSNQATAAVTYGYDGIAPSGCTPPAITASNMLGHRTGMCDASGAAAWDFDTMGRTLFEKRTIDGSTPLTATIGYTYNLDGSLATLLYPGQRVLTYTYSAAGRSVSAADTAHSLNYVTGATYAPQGALSGLLNDASLNSRWTYNNRLQPLQIYSTSGTVPPVSQLQGTCPTTPATIMSRLYNFATGTSDNGNVQSITDCLTTANTQNFAYDNLNRLTNASTTGQGTVATNWGENYTIDAWGNLTNINLKSPWHNSETLNAAAASTANQLPGFGYDAAGNMTSNGTFSYVYNGENQLRSVTQSTTTTSYVYDGDGKRPIKCTGTYPTCTAATLYWTGMGSDTLDETNWTGAFQKEYIFFDGKRVARRDGTGNTLHYYFGDHLGSANMLTSAAGVIAKSSVYYPFGGEIPVTGPSVVNPYKFTGKERDSESNLDNFRARYDGSSLGRFMTSDPASLDSVDRSNPQRWNLYAYVLNNPLRLVDPNGLDPCDTDIPASGDAKGRVAESPCLTPSPMPPDIDPCAGQSDECLKREAAKTRAEAARLLGYLASLFPGCVAQLRTAGANTQAVQRANSNWPLLQQAGSANGVDPSFLAAIGVRESGFQNIAQAGGMGRGIFQIDLGANPSVSAAQAFDPAFSANFAANMLSSNQDTLAAQHPNLSGAPLAQATAASYNFGVGNISGNSNTIDVGTTGGNYGANVLGIQSQCF